MSDKNKSYTLRSLSPLHGWDISCSEYNHEMTFHGTHILPLKIPTRSPDVSRKYISGDPVKFIDWKAYARSDQLVIRERNIDSSGRILVACDIKEYGLASSWI